MPLNWTGPRHFSMDPTSPECFDDPYAIYRELHKVAGPVYWNDYAMWCMSSFEQVERTLKHSHFARLPSHRGQHDYPAHLKQFAQVERYSLLALEAPEHSRLRRSLNRSFVVREINKLEPLIRQHAVECLDKICGNSTAELLEDYATPIPVRVIAGMLGVPFSESQQLLDWSHAMVKVYTMQQSEQDEIAANTASVEFSTRLVELINEKRVHPADDLLSSWIHEQSLGDDEMISLAVLLLNAGHEATVHQLGNAIKLLIEQPAYQRYLLESDKQAEAIVAECLRYDPPLHLFTRYAQQDLDLGNGVSIKKDEQVALLLASANRDPKRFNNPDEFQPERTDGATLALGAGTHFCVGAYLSKLELRVALQELFKRLPHLAFTDTPNYKNSYHFHGLNRVDVTWKGCPQMGTP